MYHSLSSLDIGVEMPFVHLFPLFVVKYEASERANCNGLCHIILLYFQGPVPFEPVSLVKSSMTFECRLSCSISKGLSAPSVI